MPPKAAPAATKAPPAAASKPAATSKAVAPKAAAPAKVSATKSAAPKAAGEAAKAKPATKGKTAADSKKSLEEAAPQKGSAAEEKEFLEAWGTDAPADPWRELKSPYGSQLTAAECYERFRKGTSGEDKDNKFGLQEILVVTKEELQRAIKQVSPEPKSSALAASKGLEAVLQNKSGSAEQRLAVAGCGLESFQLCRAVAERFVELDLSFNSLKSEALSSLAPNSLRSVVLSGNLLTSVPTFTADMPKLVKLDLSFNEINKLPEAEVFQKLSNLRSLSLQNCSLTSILTSSGKFAFAALASLSVLDLSFNRLSEPNELQQITCLQRLQDLDVGCNDMCASDGYESAVSSLRKRMSTLKRVNDEAVRRQFGSYGANAADRQISLIADAMSNDKSSCSCVEGNPCLTAETCYNWKDRFKVAHNARKEKYWTHGKNFCDF